MIFRAKENDRLVVDVPKGKRDVYVSAAHEFGISISGLIQLGVEEFIATHADNESVKKVKAHEKLSSQERRLVKAFETLPKESRSIVLRLVEDFALKVSAANSVD